LFTKEHEKVNFLVTKEQNWELCYFQRTLIGKFSSYQGTRVGSYSILVPNLGTGIGNFVVYQRTRKG
jgi:hypothetical protein